MDPRKLKFGEDYDVFGNRVAQIPLQYEGTLPTWLVPNPVSQSFNTTIFKSGTAFQAEIDMQNGVFYASKLSFTDFAHSGYRLGIEKETLIPKFIIGNSVTYLLWDGSVLTVSGTLYSTAGNIGGWTIGATTLTGNKVTLDSTGLIIAGDVPGQRVVMNGPGLAFELYDSADVFVGQLLGFTGGTLLVDAADSFSIFTAGNLRTFINNIGTFSHTGLGVWEGDFIPFTDSLYNLGIPIRKWDNVYANNYLSCPLPTVHNALKMVRSLKKPRRDVKGHHGKRLYFAIEDFPKQMKIKDKDGNDDIELVKTIGFLVQVVRELTAEVDKLKKIKK